MGYTMEELVPIVGKLAERYAAYGHTSMPYEQAEQLMEAVLYCIHEAETWGGEGAVLDRELSAQEAYEAGMACVEAKAKEALALYNAISQEFDHYGNCCLQDVFVRGIPEFFKWYDMELCPQDTILTLDYPVLKDISASTGIDRIYGYLVCISIEQKFLHLFPEGHVREVLLRHDSQYEDMAENICEVMLANIVGHILAGRPLAENGGFQKEDYQKMQDVWEGAGQQKLRGKLMEALSALLQGYGEGGSQALDYFSKTVDNILARLENAVGYGALPNLFP